jgi:hypothetical protein
MAPEFLPSTLPTTGGKKYHVLLEKLAPFMKREVFAFIFTQLFCSENSGIASRRKFGNFPQQHMASHSRRQESVTSDFQVTKKDNETTVINDKSGDF